MSASLDASFANAATKETCKSALKKQAQERTTRALTLSYAKVADDIFWKNWIGGNTEYLRFVAKGDYEAMKDRRHPTEMYGTDNYLSWKAADDYLNLIPVGKLELSVDLFKEVHRIATANLYPLLKGLSPGIPSGFLPTKGGILRLRPSIGIDALRGPINEKAFRNLKANEWLTGFQEIPGLSRPGARRGIILYTHPWKIETELNNLIAWYNENKGKMDPIDLAARFQRRFVSIHPLVDGNGRTSRLLMDRILREFGLPAPLLANQESDLYLSQTDYTQAVRDGVYEAVKVFQAPAYDYRIRLEFAPSIGARASRSMQSLPAFKGKSGANIDRKVPASWVTEITPQSYNKIDRLLKIGGQPFQIRQDGFLYDHFGIPHLFHEGALYPIADKTYLLYFEGGQTNAETGVRKLSDSHRQAYRANFGLINGMLKGTVDPDEVELKNYSEIEDANKTGAFHFYPWQRDLLREAATIADDDPIHVLTPSRFLLTEFDSDSKRKSEFADEIFDNPGAILAQYEMVDLKLSELLNEAKKFDPDSVEIPARVMASRRKIHQAARTLTAKFLGELEAMNPEARETLKLQPAYNVFESYWAHSKLSYATFDEGLAALGDDDIFLLRADQETAKYIGFISQDKFVEALNRLPYSQRFGDFVRELKTYLENDDNRPEIEAKLKAWQEKVNASPKLVALLPDFLQAKLNDLAKTEQELSGRVIDLLIGRIFKSRFLSKGTSAQFQRSLIDYVEHAGGFKPQKVGTSFTTLMGLLVPTYETKKLMFTSDLLPSRLYLVRLKKSEVDWNLAMLQHEYEILLKSPVGPWRIESSFSGADLGKMAPEGIAEDAADFLRRYQLGIVEPSTKPDNNFNLYWGN